MTANPGLPAEWTTPSASAAATADAGVEVTFSNGLFGFPGCTRFELLGTGHDGLFWLQSRDEDSLGFLLLDPFRFFEDYVVDVPDPELAELAPAGSAEIAVLAIVTLPRDDGERGTANLQGPVVINTRTGMASQVVVANRDYGVRCPLPGRLVPATA